MGKTLKILFFLVSIVILFIAAAAIILPLVIDPNDFKPDIEAAVKNSTGRKLTIEGDLELSVFPWLGLSTGKMILSNAPGFTDQAFASLDESNIKVKLIPLLSKQLEINRIILKGLVINLEKNKQGLSNWSDLRGSKQVTPSPAQHKRAVTDEINAAQTDAPLFASFIVGGVSLENSQINWVNNQADKKIEIQQLNLETGTVKPNAQIPIDLNFLLLDDQTKFAEQVALTTDLVINEKLDQFDFNQLALKISIESEKLPSGKIDAELSADLLLNLDVQTLNASNIQIDSGDFSIQGNLSGETILDHGQFKGVFHVSEFNLRNFLQQLKIPVPATQDQTTLQRLSMQFELSANGDGIALEKLQTTLDDTVITGLMQVSIAEPAKIDFNLQIDQIDLDRYLPITQKTAAKNKKTGTPQASIPQIPAGAPPPAVTNKELRGHTKTVSPQPAPTKATSSDNAKALFPVESLRTLNAQGQLSIDKLKVNGLQMHGVTLLLDAKKGILRSNHQVKKFYQGSTSGSININVRNKQPSLSLNEKLQSVQIEPLLRDLQSKVRASGTLYASAKLTGRGNNIEAIKSTLNGEVQIISKNGVIKGFDLQKIITRGKAMIKGEPLPQKNDNEQTPYSEIRAKATIINGLIRNDDFYAKSSTIRVRGKGTADLKNEGLDYEIIAKWVRKEATATEPEKIEGIPLHIDIDGTFSHPTYTLDIASMLTEKNKAKIEREIDKLDKKYGVGNLLKGLLNKIQN
jgi:AsmA protein